MSSLFNDIADQRAGGPMDARPAAHESHRVARPPIAKANEKIDTHSDVHKHLHNALNAKDTGEKRGHIFRALTAVNKAQRGALPGPIAASPNMMDGDDGAGPPPAGPTGPSPRAGLMAALQGMHQRRTAAGL